MSDELPSIVMGERIVYWQHQYREHIEHCDQCNYGLDCRMCEGGFPEAEEAPGMHSCNCQYGTLENGWHIGRELDRIVAQGEPPEPEPIIKRFDYSWVVEDGRWLDNLRVEVELTNGKKYRGEFHSGS